MTCDHEDHWCTMIEGLKVPVDFCYNCVPGDSPPECARKAQEAQDALERENPPVPGPC